MKFASVLVGVALHVTAVAGANLCSTGYEDSQQICGEATGNFQLLGSLCFSGGTGDDGKSSVTFALTFSNVDTVVLPLSELNKYYVLFYDDQDSSFSSINHALDTGDFQNCTTRASHSKGICSNSGSTCTYGWHVVSALNKTVSGELTTYSKTITIAEVYAREWYFVLSACDSSSAVKLHSYSISSNSAVECEEIYAQNDAGYIAAIVILALVCVVLGVVSFIFYKRTKIPELLSMVSPTLCTVVKCFTCTRGRWFFCLSITVTFLLFLGCWLGLAWLG